MSEADEQGTRAIAGPHGAGLAEKFWGFQRAKHDSWIRPGLFRFSPGASLPPWVGLPQGPLVRILKPALFSGRPAGGFGVFLSNLEPF